MPTYLGRIQTHDELCPAGKVDDCEVQSFERDCLQVKTWVDGDHEICPLPRTGQLQIRKLELLEAEMPSQ